MTCSRSRAVQPKRASWLARSSRCRTGARPSASASPAANVDLPEPAWPSTAISRTGPQEGGRARRVAASRGSGMCWKVIARKGTGGARPVSRAPPQVMPVVQANIGHHDRPGNAGGSQRVPAIVGALSCTSPAPLRIPRRLGSPAHEPTRTSVPQNPAHRRRGHRGRSGARHDRGYRRRGNRRTGPRPRGPAPGGQPRLDLALGLALRYGGRHPRGRRVPPRPDARDPRGPHRLHGSAHG